MPTGFGFGSFGNSPFGEGDWSKKVLFDLMPELYRNQDQLNDGIFEKFTQGFQPSFDDLKRKIRNYDTLRDPFLVRTQLEEVNILKLGKLISDKGKLLQKGVDGTVDGSNNFYARTARFTNADIGRTLIINKSAIPSNNRSVTIVTIVDKNTVITTPFLTTTSAIFRWEVREKVTVDLTKPTFEVRSGDVLGIGSGWEFYDGFSTVTVLTRNVFSSELQKINEHLTEKDGTDGIIDSSGRFKANSLNLTQKDVGKIITISGSSIDSNNGRFEIIAIDEISSTDKRIVFSRRLIRGEDADGGVVYQGLPEVSNVIITHVIDVPNSSLTINTSLDDKTIEVILATDSLNTITSTSEDVVNAINSDSFASTLVTAVVTGTGLGLVNVSTDSNPINGILTEDTGLLTWSLLPFAQIRLNSATLPKGVVEQEGIDLVPTLNSIFCPSGLFTANDIGKIITIVGSSTVTNNGNFEIISITDPNTIVIDTILTTEVGPLSWEIRTATNYGDDIQVRANAPSLIVDFAKDFDLEVDQREKALRQRALVAHFNQWIDKKGHDTGYEALGKISGFDVTATPLYRISRSLAVGVLDSFNVIEVGESGTGRLGTDGSILDNGDGNFSFYSPTALFKTTDVNSVVKITNANNVDNNSLFTIIGFIDVNTVLLDYSEGMVADANNGSLTWSIVRLYIDQVPTLPNYDEINSDLLTELVGTPSDYPEFTVDKFCFEPDMVDSIAVTIDTDPDATKFIAVNKAQVTISGNADVVVSVGNWYIEDDDENRFYLETVPEETFPGSGIFTFEIISSTLPGTGGILGYNCPINALCIYCAASKVYLTIEANDILNDTGIALEDILDRLLNRFNEVKPVHVSLVPRYVQPIQISFNMSMELLPNHQLVDNIIMPFGAYFDMIPGDDIPADLRIFVTVEPTIT